MASLTRKGEKCPAMGKGTHWSRDVTHYSKTIGFFSGSPGYEEGSSGHPKERPSPEGAGSGGDSRRIINQRTSGAPSSKSPKVEPPGPGGDQRGNTASGSGTGSYGPTMSENISARSCGRKVPCCDKCSATLVALKKQALSLAVHHHLSSKDLSAMSAFLHDNLRVHSSRSTVDSKEKDGDRGGCGACGAYLTQLKQEAIHLALTREHPKWSGHSMPVQRETKSGDKAPREATTAIAALASVQSHARTHSPHSPHSPRTPRSPRTPQRTPQSPRRRGPKLPNPDMDRWVEEQQQLAAATAKSVSVNSSNGVAIYPYHQSAEDVTESYSDAGTLKTSPRIAHISRVATIANTAAMSFLARAAQKLNLSYRKKSLSPGPAGAGSPVHLSTCFRGIIQKSPPPVPHCLLQAVAKAKDSPSTGKVSVVLRVCPVSGGSSQPPALRVDASRRRVTVVDPVCSPRSTQTRRGDGKALLKTYTFDAAYPPESSQAEVCAGVLADVIRCVVSGGDGCVLGLGCADVGSWSTMVGSDEGTQKLGVIPSAIAWLYSAIERRKERTWTDLIVSVSAIELCCGEEEEEETLRDLLAEVAPSSGNIQDSPAPQISLREDPVHGIQLRNHNRVKAPNAERAASLLDAAIASRLYGNQARGGGGGGGGAGGDIIATPYRSSVMFFTLHVQPPRTEISCSGKASRGPSRLTMIDVRTTMKRKSATSRSRSGLPHSELGPVILSLLSGHKNIPSKGSKVSLLLRESLGHVNCLTTVIAEASDSPAHLLEAVSTIQLAARIRRTQKRTQQSTSCSPCGRSLGKERRGPRSLTLRAFHSTGEVDVDVPRLRLRGDLDECSGSDQSCDTVIHIDSDGSVQPKAALALSQPEFVPIIPSLHPCKTDTDDPEFAALLQELLSIPRPQGEKKKDETVPGKVETQRGEMKQPERDCLKCDTFAELQERLGCIDGSETVTDVPKLSSTDLSANVADKSRPQNDTVKRTDSESPEAPQTLLNQEFSCSQTSAGEKQTDGTFPGDSFQREDSGLYDCEEGSAASSSEEPSNQTLSLNKICRADLSDLSDSGSVKMSDNLSSQSYDVDAQCTAVPGSVAFVLEPAGSQRSSEARDWFKPEMRTSPVGKSSLFSPPSSSSSSPSLATSVILGDILPHLPAEEVNEMKATITVTVQQPLDHAGQDELVFSMVEEVTISGALDRSRRGCNIIHIKDTDQSPARVQGSASSRPIRIISNVSEEVGPAECSECSKPAVRAIAKDIEASAQKPPSHFRGENRLLPSFINPMLVNTDSDCNLEGAQTRGSCNNSFTGGKSLFEPRQDKPNSAENRIAAGDERGASALENHDKKPDSVSMSPLRQISYNTPVFEDAALYENRAENKACGKEHRNTDRSHSRGRERVYPANAPKGLLGVEISRRVAGNAPESVAVSPGRLATAPAALKTASLPRVWHNANQDGSWGGRGADDHRAPRAVTSSTPCSPGATLERRQSMQHSRATYNLPYSPSRKYSMEYRPEGSSPMRKGIGPSLDTSSLSMKHDRRLKSPIEESSKLFSAKLEQLASRTNSLGSLDRDSTTSVSSKGSYEESFKGSYEGDSTLPRASRSPRRTPRSAPMADPSLYTTTSNNHPSQSPRSTRSKLSAVGKLKLASPKLRRLSAPGTKNLSFSPKGLQQSINRSASLSPDGKTFSPESFLSSSPTWSSYSISRSQSQSSACANTKTPIQGVINGRISDLLRERETSASSGGFDKAASRSPVAEDRLSSPSSSINHHPLPSPYSRVTAPRTPSHQSGHASDTTSVLSGELPPAMGKTSLRLPNRNSVVSSGYESMVRDSEATGSSTSNRDSVSDKSCSLLSVCRSSRTSRRRGNTGSHHRRLSHDIPTSLRRSASGPRARWVDRGIPEAYEIKVYEIDDVERMQRRAAAGKLGPGCFSAKLKFLEHRQQRISEVRAKYSNLKRELEQAKQNLMLEPAKWNQEFDLWQTFEVDSLEHLEALEAVTSRLESRLNLCKANVMMVTCFDVSAKRRQKKRRRAAPQPRGFVGI
ncbi:kinesin-like protein KIF26B [Polymixia lowei]